MAELEAGRPRGWRLLAAALGSRTAGSMLALGFSSGLPFALLIGTINAWLGDAKVNLATIGVLSWIGLAYAFQFLWSPLVDRLALPVVGRLGRRKGWILLCQMVLCAVLLALAATDPAVAIGRFALLAVAGAVASATQDIAINAWRIDIADAATPVELLSALYQLGYRSAAIVGGAFALFLGARLFLAGGVRGHGRCSRSGGDRDPVRSRHAAAVRRRRSRGAARAGRGRCAGAGARAGRRRTVLAMGGADHRWLHGSHAGAARAGGQAALGVGLPAQPWPADRGRDGAGAAGRRRAAQPDEGDGQVRPARRRCRPERGGRGRRPPLSRTGRAAGGNWSGDCAGGCWASSA